MSFLVTGQIHTEMRFGELTKLVEVRVNAALVEWAKIALEEVVRAETRVGTRTDEPWRDKYGTRGQHLRDSFSWAIGKTTFGLANAVVVVYTSNPNAIWQELGTRARRRKKLKSGGGGGQFPFRTPPQAEGTNRGVPPLYFMRKGMKRAYPRGVELMQLALAGIGEYGGGSALVDTTGLKSTSTPPRPF